LGSTGRSNLSSSADQPLSHEKFNTAGETVVQLLVTVGWFGAFAPVATPAV